MRKQINLLINYHLQMKKRWSFLPAKYYNSFYSQNKYIKLNSFLFQTETNLHRLTRYKVVTQVSRYKNLSKIISIYKNLPTSSPKFDSKIFIYLLNNIIFKNNTVRKFYFLPINNFKTNIFSNLTLNKLFYQYEKNFRYFHNNKYLPIKIRSMFKFKTFLAHNVKYNDFLSLKSYNNEKLFKEQLSHTIVPYNNIVETLTKPIIRLYDKNFENYNVYYVNTKQVNFFRAGYKFPYIAKLSSIFTLNSFVKFNYFYGWYTKRQKRIINPYKKKSNYFFNINYYSFKPNQVTKHNNRQIQELYNSLDLKPKYISIKDIFYRNKTH